VLTVLNGLNHAPKDVRDTTDDAHGDSLADLTWFERLGRAYLAADPATQQLMDSLPAGTAEMGIKAFSKIRASLARRYGDAEETAAQLKGGYAPT
jgi:hypothetical protein